ncbi:DNA-directed RNA polymerase subunit beta [Candidatus Vidania fulgoroideorum]
MIFSKNKFIKNHNKIVPNLTLCQKDSFNIIFNKKSLYYIKNAIDRHFPIFSTDGINEIKLFDLYYKKLKFYISTIIKNNKEKFFLFKKFVLFEIPKFLKNCSFLVNDIQRAIVFQLYKSPGIYYENNNLFSFFKIIPLNGFWIEFTYNKKNKKINFKIDNKKKLDLMVLIKCFDIDIYSIYNFLKKKRTIKFFRGSFYLKSFKKDKLSKFPIFKKRIGNYFEIRKEILKEFVIAKDFFINKIFFRNNTKVNYKKILYALKKKSCNFKFKIYDIEKKEIRLEKIFSNKFTKSKCYDMFYKYYNKYRVNEEENKKFFEKLFNEGHYKLGFVRKKLNEFFRCNTKSNNIKKKDILNIIKFLIFNKTHKTDLDSLDNKRIRGSGLYIYEIIEKKMNFLKNNIIDRISSKKDNNYNSIISNKILNNYVKEFFCTSQFSQFLDDNNNLSEITHKRRVTLTGPKGIKRNSSTISARNIHHSNYGRICPIETPEGHNIGLVNSLSLFAKINNENFFIYTPYYEIKKYKIKKIIYIKYSKEFNKRISNNYFFSKNFFICKKNKEFEYCKKKKIKYCSITQIQNFSIASLHIPFMEHNDANRSLMGSNMQRQSITSITKQNSIISTGLESIVPKDLKYIYSLKKKPLYLDSKRIIILKLIKNIKIFKIILFDKFLCSNQKNIINNNINLKKNEIFNDNSNTLDKKLSLGKNVLASFMFYKGYNFEDSIIVSEELVNNDFFTTLHTEKLEFDFSNNDLKNVKKNKVYIRKENYKKLNKKGIAKEGYYFYPNDIIISKVEKKKTLNLYPEEKLLSSLKNIKKNKYKEKFIKIPNGVSGKLIKVEYIYNIKIKKEKFCYLIIKKNILNEIKKTKNKYKKIILKNRIIYIKNKINKKKKKKKKLKKIIFTFAEKRKLSIGDKMSGRHGNKGVVSKILPSEEMPYLKDGTKIQIILNPLGVPSRMNIGQIYELKIGLTMFLLKKIIKYKKNKKKILFNTIPFEGLNEKYIKEINERFINKELIKKFGIDKNVEKVRMYDGKTGKKYKKKISFGYMYFMKLHHISYNKIHARSIGPYSLITQQPLKGKSKFGGQRFGEMEVWALSAYGAAYTLQEMITLKSDDVKGRKINYTNISLGIKEKKYYLPESFNTLVSELKALCIDVIAK